MIAQIRSILKRIRLPRTADVLVVRSRHDLALSSIASGFSSIVVDPTSFPLFLTFRYVSNFLLNRRSSRIARHLVALSRSCRVRVILATDSVKELTEVAELLPDIEVIAVMHGFYIDQRGIRLRENWTTQQRSRVTLFAIGPYDIDHYQRWGNLHDDIRPVGSVNNCLYLTKCDRSQTFSYDLCIVQGSLNPHAEDHFSLLRLANWQRIVNLVIQLDRLDPLEIVISLNSSSKQEAIQEWFSQQLPRATFLKSSLDRFATYRAIDYSKISIGEASTALVEGLARGNRCLAINSSGLSILSLPVPHLVSLVDPTFEEFRSRYHDLRSISDAEFRRTIHNDLQYLINIDEQHLVIQKVRDHINRFCRTS